MTTADGILQVRGLTVAYAGSTTPALQDVTFEVEPGECVGVVGTSGSGKSSLALALLGLLPAAGRIVHGSVRIQGHDVGAGVKAWPQIRGRVAGLVFQDAGKALDPLYTVSFHLIEAGVDRDDVDQALAVVGLGAALRDRYPHQLSGGQRQRVMVAVATAQSPALLIADEPTASLDPVSQLTVLHALDRARLRAGSAMLLISHDLAVISRMADRIIVLSDGVIAESGPAARLLTAPSHPATRSLVVACS